ncbi:MAG TPA: DnaA/Hda family protein [Nitrososphaeraceae archaeon]
MTWEDFCKHNKIGSRFHAASIEACQTEHLLVIPNDLTGKSFIFWGEAGTGKTYFSLSLIRHLLDEKMEVRWIQATEFEDKLIASKREFGEAKHVIETFSDCDFLFIDDFGTERSNEDLAKEWYQLINYRWSNAKQTVFTTNLNREEVLKNYGKRIYSRFKDFEWVEFTGPDLRGKR